MSCGLLETLKFSVLELQEHLDTYNGKREAAEEVSCPRYTLVPIYSYSTLTYRFLNPQTNSMANYHSTYLYSDQPCTRTLGGTSMASHL